MPWKQTILKIFEGKIKRLPGGTVDKDLSAKEGDGPLIRGPGRFHMSWSS